LRLATTTPLSLSSDISNEKHDAFLTDPLGCYASLLISLEAMFTEECRTMMNSARGREW
jgi:hypothetical protein